MPARVPLDVDLEDKLLYGLTPTRLAYLVTALLAGFAIWSSPWAPLPVRGSAALLVIALGAASSWGRWRGRPADVWFVDIVLFAGRTYRVAWNKHLF
ncbi:MAG: PrgI family protein [Candidatus Dormibacteraeota bacterium]|nr:PrgI family protein [Candidatus Dormibacteraeota bacterium]